MKKTNENLVDASVTETENKLFNDVFGLVVELSKDTVRKGKVRVNNYGDYAAKIDNSARFNKREITILGWKVSIVNYNFIKSNCPHMTVMLKDALKVLTSELTIKK